MITHLHHVLVLNTVHRLSVSLLQCVTSGAANYRHTYQLRDTAALQTQLRTLQRGHIHLKMHLFLCFCPVKTLSSEYIWEDCFHVQVVKTGFILKHWSMFRHMMQSIQLDTNKISLRLQSTFSVVIRRLYKIIPDISTKMCSDCVLYPAQWRVTLFCLDILHLFSLELLCGFMRAQ